MKTPLMCAVLYACAALPGRASSGTPVHQPAWTFPPRAEASSNTGVAFSASQQTDTSGILVQRVAFDLRDRNVSYQMPLDSANPQLPLVPAPKWRPYSPLFRIIGLNGTRGPGEWLLDWQAASTGTVENAGLLLSSRLDAWGIVDDGDGEVAVMIWAEPGGLPIATLLIKDIPETGWVAFAFYPGVVGAAGSTLMFENLPETYWPSKGTLRRDAVANAAGDFAYEREGMRWELDAVRFWALTHNLGSQQKAGVGYVFHPEDFEWLTINRGRGGVRAEIRPGVDCARFALGDFSGVPWFDALESKRAEFPEVLAFLEHGVAPRRFHPVVADRERRRRLQMLTTAPGSASADSEALQAAAAFLEAFSEAESQGVVLGGLQVWFHHVNRAAAAETVLCRHLMEAEMSEE